MTDSELADEIERAARYVEYKWPGVMEWEEIASEIWIRLLESSTYWERAEALEPGERRNLLRKLGQRIVSGEKTSYEEFSGNIHYGTDEVKYLLNNGGLERVETIAMAGSSWVIGDDVIKGEHTARAVVESMVDLQNGVRALGARNILYLEALVNRYVYGVEPRDKSERNRITRGIRALTEEMNTAHREGDRCHEGIGSRKNKSNGQAIASTAA